MKFLAFAAAGLIAASAVAPAPAEAQRYGYDRHDRGWNNRGWDRGHDRRGWDNRRWDRGRHYGHRSRSYLRCTWVRGWYGPERRCWRVYR